VTEQVAEHTNGTIGALLNATFGNAPELLIATAALRSGFYRVVQLAMLGSMLTNLLLVFGMSCLVGGMRWQVQELRITSGNVSVGMLMLAVAGSLLPAGLVLAGQLRNDTGEVAVEGVPTKEELQFSRVNAVIMMFMYGFYLIFQLGTHKEEFDDEENIVESADGHQLHMSPHFTSRHGRQQKARRNKFCMSIMNRFSYGRSQSFMSVANSNGDVEMHRRSSTDQLLAATDDDGSDGNAGGGDSDFDSDSAGSNGSGGKLLPQNEISKSPSYANGYFDEYNDVSVTSRSRTSETDSARRRRPSKSPRGGGGRSTSAHHEPGRLVPLGLADPAEVPLREYT
jgi:Ca2+/Na+ antiporter